jgi:predicted AlkP superfamily pyrophosphatase or phosphodiesterase
MDRISNLKFSLSCTTVVIFFLIGNALSNPTTKQTSNKLSKHPKVLVVSFDGFRYDYMQKTATPNLQAIKAEGVSVPWMRAQFPTKTFPNHQTMATGLYPASHGITDNVVWDPLHGRELNGFNDDKEFWNFSPDVLPLYVIE